MNCQSLHVHTTFCDGKNTPEEMVQGALAAGCTSLGFSGHSPLSSDGSWTMQEAEVPRYREEILRLRRQYAGQIEIFLGLEQDLFSPDPGPGWDYRIGSVHCVEKDGVYLSADDCLERFCRDAARHYGGDFLAYAADYYRLETQVAKRTGCEIVGHFDLITKFNEGDRLFDTGDRRYRAAALEALDALLETGAIFEINTGAMSRGYRTIPYPAPFLLRRIRERGGRITITSDSHSRDTILYGYADAFALARSCGFGEYWVLTAGGFRAEAIPDN